MSYFDGIFKPCTSGYCDSLPQKPTDSCMVFNISKGTRLVASRMREGVIPPASLKEIMSADELAFLVEYLNSYAHRPIVVSTSLGFALVFPVLYPSTSLCVMSIADIGGENFLRVAKNQKWDIALSPIAAKRQLRSTGIRAGHVEVSTHLWNMLLGCFAPFDNIGDYSPHELLEFRAIAITEYVSRRARIMLDASIFASEEIDFPLYLAFILLFVMSGYASGAEECAKISVSDHSHGIEVSIVEKAGRDRARIVGALSEVCGRDNIPFEYFYEDGRVFARLVPIRKDWAYLGIKSPESN